MRCGSPLTDPYNGKALSGRRWRLKSRAKPPCRPAL